MHACNVYCSPEVVSVKPGLWTLDWTDGLDYGLKFGLGFGLVRRVVTTISSYKSMTIIVVSTSQWL